MPGNHKLPCADDGEICVYCGVGGDMRFFVGVVVVMTVLAVASVKVVVTVMVVVVGYSSNDDGGGDAIYS